MVSLFLCQSSIGRPVFCLHLVEFTVYFEKRVVNHSQNIWHAEGLKLSQCKPGETFFPVFQKLTATGFFNWDFMMLEILNLLFLTHESRDWSSPNRKFLSHYFSIPSLQLLVQERDNCIPFFSIISAPNVTISSHFSLSFLLPRFSANNLWWPQFLKLNDCLKTNMLLFSPCQWNTSF